MRCHHTFIKRAGIKNSDNPKCWWRCSETGPLTSEWEVVQPRWATRWQLLFKIIIINQTPSLFGFSTNALFLFQDGLAASIANVTTELEQSSETSRSHKNLCVMSTASLSATAPSWRRPRRPSVGGRLHQPWSRPLGHDLATRGTDGHAVRTWVNFRRTLPRGRGQPESPTVCLASRNVLEMAGPQDGGPRWPGAVKAGWGGGEGARPWDAAAGS